MTFKRHALKCLFVCIFSLLSVLLCVNSVEDPTKTRDLLYWSLLSIASGFSINRFLDRGETPIPGLADLVIEGSGWEKNVAVMAVWLPILLAFFAIGSIQLSAISAEHVLWVAVTLAYLTGHRIARLYGLIRCS